MYFELFLAGKMAYRNRRIQYLPFIRILAVTGMVLGTVALTLTAGILRGFEKNLIDKITGFDAHIRAVSLLDRDVEPSVSMERSMEESPLITDFSPFSTGEAVLRSNYGKEGTVLEAMDAEAFRRIQGPSKQLVSGTTDLIPGQILLGKGIAEALNVNAGDTVQILRIPENISLSHRLDSYPCQVSGVFSTGMAEYDRALAYMDLDSFSKIFNTEGRISGYQIMTEDPEDHEQLVRWSDENISYPFYYLTWKERHSVLFRWLETQKLPIIIIFGLISLVAVVNIISTLYMIVIVKEKEIAILKALGLSGRRIRRLFFLDGLLMSGAGIGLGLVISRFLEWGQMRWSWISISADVYFIDRIPISIDADIMLLIAAVGILISLAASLYPASRAASVKPFELLRYE